MSSGTGWGLRRQSEPGRQAGGPGPRAAGPATVAGTVDGEHGEPATLNVHTAGAVQVLEDPVPIPECGGLRGDETHGRCPRRCRLSHAAR